MAGLRKYETHPKLDMAVLERNRVFDLPQPEIMGFESGGIAMLLIYKRSAEVIHLYFDADHGVTRQVIDLGYAHRKSGPERYFVCPDSGSRCRELHFYEDHFVSRRMHPRINSKKPPPAHRRTAKLIMLRDRVLGLNGYPKAEGREWLKLLAELVTEPFLLQRFPELTEEHGRFHRVIKRVRRHNARQSPALDRGSFSLSLRRGRRDKEPIDLSTHLERTPQEWLQSIQEPRDRFGNSPIAFLEDQSSIDLRQLARAWRLDEHGVWAQRVVWPKLKAVLIVDFRSRDLPLLAVREIASLGGQPSDDLVIKLVPSAFKGRWFMECPLSGKRCDVLYWRDDVFASARALRYVHRSQRR